MVKVHRSDFLSKSCECPMSDLSPFVQIMKSPSGSTHMETRFTRLSHSGRDPLILFFETSLLLFDE